MDKLTQADLQQLMELREANCVSIFVPMVRDDPQQYDGNRIYFKNGLSDIREQLTEMSEEERDSYLQPLSRLLTDDVFWGNQSHGLAAFLTDGYVETYRLPIEFEPTTYVANRFYIKPLLAYFENNQTFHVLAMSQNNVRLYSGNRFDVEAVALDDVPTSLEEALRFDDPEKQQQGHTSAMRQGRGDNTDVMFHSHDPQDEHVSNLKRFAWHVRNGLRDILNEDKAPIVLAGPPETVAYLRDSADFNFTEKGITGNVDHLDGKALREKAWPLVEPLFSAEREQSAEKYNNLSETDQVTTERTKVIQAAYFGAIDTLFVPADESLFGTFDKDAGTVEVHAIRQEDSIDLIDAAAVKTLASGGKVYLNGSETPNFGAILRYTADALTG